jgi:REP element-mobilizing transposase RayT
MGLPRSKYVQEGQEGVYHCFSRCVRRAFLYGFDKLTLRDFSHRKAWLVERLRHLAAIFAIDVCAYAVMENHYHAILRTRPDIVVGWSDREVATRWLTLFPRHHDLRGTPIPAAEKEICALSDCPERIAQLRQRLSSLSWFMGRLNEFIARAANKEDGVKGRFWEARFKCQVLLDEAAIAACMVYVDLNPIRAGLAGTPEESDFTSIQERIRAWQKETMTTASVPREPAQDMQSGSFDRDMRMLESAREISNPVPEHISALRNSFDGAALSACWLCPIQSDSERRGILQMTTAEYFDLVDKSGRMTRSHKRGAIDADLAPILLRIGANPEAWLETISRFGSKFCLAAGLLSNLRNFADQLGRRWLKGVATARTAFASSPPQLA